MTQKEQIDKILKELGAEGLSGAKGSDMSEIGDEYIDLDEGMEPVPAFAPN